MADLVKVRYIGPHTEGVEIADQYCAHGDTIEVSNEVAAGLAGQEDSWEIAGKKRAAAAKPKAKRVKKSPIIDEVDAAAETEDTTTGDTADEQGA